MLSRFHQHSISGVCHSPADFCADFRIYPCSLPRLSAPIRAYLRLSALTPTYSHLLPHTPAHADAQILTGE